MAIRCCMLWAASVMMLSSLSWFPVDALNSHGKTFIVSFLDNEVEFWQDLPLELWVINDESSTATVSISAPRDNNLLRPECTGERTVTVGAGQQHKFGVCWWGKIMNTDNSVNDKVIRIESDTEISVIAVNKEAFSADSYLVLPIDSLGTSYYAMVAGPSNKPNMLAVAATEDMTTVTITLPPEAADEPPVELNHRCLVYQSSDSFTIRLHAHQVFYFSSLADITGTYILSSKPVAVFSGNTRTAVPATDTARDHLAEQMISIGNWDNSYIYKPISKQTPDGDNVRLISNTDGNQINWIQTGGSTNSFTLNRGEWRELFLSDTTYIWSESNSPFSAIVITLSQPSPDDGSPTDPAMMNLQGRNQWATKYTIPAFRSAQSTLNNGAETRYTANQIEITAENGDVSGLRMDGNSITFDYCAVVPGNIAIEACLLTFDGENAHTFTHVNGNKFGAVLFTSSDRESLATSPSLESPPRCESTVMSRGDEVDNDCDGQLDEEICDSIDNDEDGLIDEDCASSTGQARGRTYVIVYPDNSKSDGNTGDLNKLELYISPQNIEASTSVTVSNPLGTYTTTVNAQALMTTQIDIPIEFRLPQGSGKYNKGLLIEATDDIVVYAMNKIRFSSESYLAIPVDVTGYDYFTISTEVTDGNDVAEFAVCASETGITELDITLADISGVSVNYEGQSYGRAQTISTSLIQYECLQIQSGTDLTGSRVSSTNQKRVSVFSGNRRPIIGGGSARDHIVEQIPPLTAWGREFYTNPIQRDGTEGSTRGDIFRVVASSDNTVVTVSSTGATAGTYNIPSAGGFMEFDIPSDEYTMMSSNEPILLAQFTKTQLNNDQNRDKGDPSMTLVVPKEAWSNDYRFVSPLSGQEAPESTDANKVYLPYTSRMSIIIETQFISKLRYRTVDTLFSDEFPAAQWVSIPNTNPSVSATTVDVEFGQNYVTAADDNIFSAMIYGAADREFYANPISLKLSQGTCEQSVSVSGDGVDNDCDDVTDEEICNGLDDDNDGLIDEDCADQPTAFRYLFTFMDNIVEYPLYQPLKVMASAKCPGSTGVRLRTPNAPNHLRCDIAVNIEENDNQYFSLSQWFRLTDNGIYNRAVLVESSCSVDIAGFNMDKFSNDAFLAFEVSQLGREYRAISYYPTTLGSVMSVIAVDSTTVTIELPTHGNNPASNPTIRHPVTNVTVNAGQSFSVAMDQYQAMQLTSEGDLSGTIVTSNNADVAVASGNIRVGINSKSRDHIVEQLPPWNRASNEWVVAANGMTSTEFVKFTCQSGASVTFPSYPGVSGQTFSFSTNGQAETFEVPQNYSGRVTSTNGNCQLYIITRSQATKSAPLLGDPTMSTVVPVSQYITTARFSIPKKPWRRLRNGEIDYYRSTLVVVSRTDQTASIKLDGNELTSWQSISGTIYSVAREQVERRVDGKSSLVQSDNGERFEARLWAVADRESFAYTLGLNY